MTELTIPGSERWMLDSTAVGGRYRLTLVHPRPRVEGPVPLLILLDGETMVLTATEFLRTMSAMANGILRPVALLAVMAEAESGPGYVATRFRDFTPQAWTLPGPFAVDMPLASLGTGGADRLVAAMVDEMLPQVRARLSIDDARIGVCGWSLSGLCAAHAWLSRSDIFSDLVAISPSLWWHDAVIVDVPMAPRPSSHRAVITAGQHEEGDPDLVWPRIFVNQAQREIAAMVRNAERFGARVADSGATTHLAVLADEHHATLVPASIARALVHLYG